MLYRNFVDQDSIDAEYNPLLTAPGAPDAIARWEAESARARAELNGRLGLRFGPTRDEYLDLFPAAASGAPVHLFIHGGYWRRFSAGEFSWVARELVGAGITVAVSNYALCPKVTLDEIVRQTRAAIAWLCTRLDEDAGDRTKLTISGHSAGGHLVAMALATDWTGEYGLARNPISGALAISGIYDLAPLPYSYIQPQVQLTCDQVRRNSPINLIPEQGPPLVVAVGGEESAEFRRQSRAYLEVWQQAGLTGRRLEVPGCNHFSVLDGFADRDSELFRAVVELCGG